MRTYNKRIAFLVSYQTLIPHGGIGQFAKSFVELMTNYGIKVDIVTDKEPQDSKFVTSIKDVGANFVYPDVSLPYTTHSAIFMYGDSYCYERMANFRNAIVKALSTNLYDAIVCNTYESIQVATTLGLEDCIQVIAYTHLESQIFKDTKNPFLHSVNDMMRKQLEVSNITIGTQSKFNQLQFNNALELPIPFTEPGLLKEFHKPREGVLFIGRWEEGKNPELYLDLIEQTKLPARIITNANGAKKFDDRLKKMGIDYQIVVGVTGKEKIDFITGCRVAFNPSTVESYGLAFLEQMSQLPTVALEGMRWLENFNSAYYFITTKKKMAETVLLLYEQYENASDWYVQGALTHILAKENDCFHKWNECFNEFEAKQSNSKTAKICEHDTVCYKEFIVDLNRTVLCIDDIRSVLTNKHKYATIYTDDNTYLSKDPNFTPVEKRLGLQLFEFI